MEMGKTGSAIKTDRQLVNRFATLLAVTYSVFTVYTAGFGLLPNLIQRSIHLGFALVLCFLINPFLKGKTNLFGNIISLIAISMATLTTGYIIFKYDYIVMNPGISKGFEAIFGFLLILVVLEATRRNLGWFFVIFVGLFLIYGFFGDGAPGILNHPGLSFQRYMQALYLTSQGIWGPLMAVSANVIAMFVVFGSVLLFTGAGNTFFEIAIFLLGRVRGGAAQMAALVSALFGTINGSAVANVATTGTFTIPMMKRIGYSPNFAGAVEATASTGGQIMPPIMGAGAFLLAELAGVSYFKVLIAALIPSILYYVSLFSTIYFEATKEELKPIPNAEIPSRQKVFRLEKIVLLIAPIVTLIWLIIEGYSPTNAVFWATVINIVLYILFSIKSGRTAKEIISDLLKGLEDGGKGVVVIAVLIAAAQIVVSTINLTGLGIKFMELIMTVSGGNFLLMLLIAMIVSILISMGAPTVAAYALSAAVVAPALIQGNVDIMAAHLFVYYFACIAAITPPVAPAVYVAIGLSNGDFWGTAFNAVRLGLSGFLVPFMFVYDKVLLMEGTTLEVSLALMTGIVGIIALSAATSGFLLGKLSTIQRLILIVGSFTLVIPGLYTDMVGLFITAAVIIWNHLNTKTIKDYVPS